MCSTASALAGLLQGQEMQGAESEVQRSNQRIVDLTKRLEKHTGTEYNKRIDTSKTARGDWTGTYKYWDGWDDVEELQGEISTEKEKLESMMEKISNPMGHCHSHTEERQMFELPEKEKMGFCERHRSMGNFLYAEGVLPKAAEQYRTALSYYDYCFPEETEEQIRLEEVRHAAQTNISLCYRQMGYGKEAIEMASQAIRDSKDRRNHFSSKAIGKAYFRRAQAYLQQHEYDLAMDDLKEAETLLPESERGRITQEMLVVQAQKKAYLENSKVMAKKIMSAKESTDEQEGEYRTELDSKVKHETPCKTLQVPNSSTKENAPLACLDISIPLEPKCVTIRKSMTA